MTSYQTLKQRHCQEIDLMTRLLALLNIFVQQVVHTLSTGVFKGTKWAVSGGKRIHSAWYWKGSIVSAGIRTFDPWISENSLPLSYLTCWWIDIKVAYIKYQILCLQIIKCMHLLQNDKLWTISNKMLYQNSNNINISYHRCLSDKKMRRNLQQEVILCVLKKKENKLTFCDIILLL